MQKQFKISGQSIKEWPEVFKDLYMDTTPLEYLESMTLEFSNGRIWKIDVIDQLENIDRNEISNRILNTFEEYHTEITKIDFRIDISKLRKNTEKFN
jgi:hypothetical protein